MDPQKNKLTYTRSLNAKKKTQFVNKIFNIYSIQR